MNPIDFILANLVFTVVVSALTGAGVYLLVQLAWVPGDDLDPILVDRGEIVGTENDR